MFAQTRIIHYYVCLGAASGKECKVNMKAIATIVDSHHQLSALAIVSTFKSFSSIAFQAMAGYLIDLYSYPFFYGFLLVCSFAGLILCLFYKIPNGNEHRLFD